MRPDRVRDGVLLLIALAVAILIATVLLPAHPWDAIR